MGTVDDESYNSDVSDVSDVNQQQHAPSSRTKSLSNTFVSKSKTLAPFAPGSTKDPELGSDIQRYGLSYASNESDPFEFSGENARRKNATFGSKFH